MSIHQHDEFDALTKRIALEEKVPYGIALQRARERRPDLWGPVAAMYDGMGSDRERGRAVATEVRRVGERHGLRIELVGGADDATETQFNDHCRRIAAERGVPLGEAFQLARSERPDLWATIASSRYPR